MEQKEKKTGTIVVDAEISPAAMIQQAVAGNADLSKLEKLLEIQEKWEANQARKAYHVAMAAFKANPPKIDKDKHVAYKEVKYDHASLANVCEKINAELSKHGLSSSWTTKQNGAILVTCKITHVQGHSEETTLSAAADATGSKNSIQAIGSTISYLCRYTLLCLTGLATSDQDNDGQTAGVEYITPDQSVYLQNLVAELKFNDANKAKFLKFMNAATFDEIRKPDYQKGENILKAHKAKVEKNGNN